MIDNGTYKKVFTYGPGGGRYRMDSYYNNGLQSSKIYVGNCEFLYDSEGNLTSTRTILSAPTGVFAVSEAEEESTGILHYIHTDYLGSWLKITSNPTLGDPVVENSYSYDAWGRPRNPATWELLPISYDRALGNLNAMQPRFDRGYTGHEELCGFGLINMNGRMYDPYLQRFLSPDNVVSSPDDAQSYNRYTYCLNNPLFYTDPTGWTETTWNPGEPWGGNYAYYTGFRVTFRGMDFLNYYGPRCGHGVTYNFAKGCMPAGALGYKYDWSSGTYIDNGTGEEVSFTYINNKYVIPNSYSLTREGIKEFFRRLQSTPNPSKGNGNNFLASIMKVASSIGSTFGMKNIYSAGIFSFEFYQVAMCFIENVGPKGGFFVSGYLYTYKSSYGTWFVETSVSAYCPFAEEIGAEMSYSGTTDLIVNGSVVQSQNLIADDEVALIKSEYSYIGYTIMQMPEFGNVDLRLNVSYIMNDSGQKSGSVPPLRRIITIY